MAKKRLSTTDSLTHLNTNLNCCYDFRISGLIINPNNQEKLHCFMQRWQIYDLKARLIKYFDASLTHHSLICFTSILHQK
jgi:hypothetical protein